MQGPGNVARTHYAGAALTATGSSRRGAETAIAGDEGENWGDELGRSGNRKSLRRLLEEADGEVGEIACSVGPGGVCVGDVAAHGVVDFGFGKAHSGPSSKLLKYPGGHYFDAAGEGTSS